MSVPLCKFCTAQGAEKVLAGNTIFITSPLDLNDPFEMRPAWTNEHELDQYENQQIRSTLVTGMPLYVCTEKGLVKGGTMPLLKVEPPAPVDDQIGIADRYNKFVFDALHSRFRVLSLVPSVVDLSNTLTKSTPQDTLMWSHYGDQFQGVCLVLDAEKFNNGLQAGGYPVTYEAQRRSLPPVIYGAWKNLVMSHDPSATEESERQLHQRYMEMLTSKSPMWGYENEIRMIYDLAKLDPVFDYTEISFACADCRERGLPKESCKMPWFRDAVRLPSEAVLGVIFGADCPSNYVTRLLPILAEERYKNVKLYWSSLHSAEYVIHYLERDAKTISIHQKAHSERVAGAKNHYIYKDGLTSCSTYAAQKGVNYHPPS